MAVFESKINDLYFSMKQSVDSYEITPAEKVYSVMVLDGLQKVIVFIEDLTQLNKEVSGRSSR